MKLFAVHLIILVLTATANRLPTVLPTSLPGPSYHTIRTYEGYRTRMPSEGVVNMLVIPINFSDASCQLILEGCQQTRQNIQQAFFGETEDLRWHSVASYYQESSYGKLTITGMVMDWFTPTITAVALSENRQLLNSQVIQPGIDAFKLQYPQLVRQYDADQDGYLDAVYFIYSLTYNPDDVRFGKDKGVFWAFVSYQGAQSNVTSPNLFHYGWSSYDFMYEDGYYQRSPNGKVEWDDDNEPIFFPWLNEDGSRSVDAHVFIHEVGHLLGLLDYYSYDRSLGDWGPSGALDMMDFNIGDHNGFSKSVLGWVDPTIVTQSTTITLSPLALTPQVLLVAPEPITTLMQEYILIELYTPLGLQAKDSQEPFAGRYPRMFTQAGIRLYHVDARIAEMNNQGGYRYVTSLDPRETRYRLAHQNTASRSLNPEYKLIHLLEASGQNTFRHQGFATNATLFQTGTTFNVTGAFLLNQGVPFGYRIHIESTSVMSAQIRIEKLPN
jgi:M6 family metalloprotease-like protein